MPRISYHLGWAGLGCIITRCSLYTSSFAVSAEQDLAPLHDRHGSNPGRLQLVSPSYTVFCCACRCSPDPARRGMAAPLAKCVLALECVSHSHQCVAMSADQDLKPLHDWHGSSPGRLHPGSRAFGHVQPLLHALLDQRHVAGLCHIPAPSRSRG